MRDLTWNLEWAKPGSKAGQAIADVLQAVRPDVAVLTEAVDELAPR